MSAQSTESRPFLQYYYDVLEEVQPLIPPSEFSVFTVIFRETLGRKNQRDDWQHAAISYTFLEQRTGLCRRVLKKLLVSLRNKKLIRFSDTVGKWGTHIYSLAKRFITGNAQDGYGEESSIAQNAIVQKPLPGAIAQNAIVVWHKMPQNYSTDDHTSIAQNAIDEPSPASFDAAPEVPADESERGAKETLKEKKEIYKEREFIEEEGKKEEEPEEEYEPQAPEWQSVLEKIKAQVSWGSFNSFFRGSRAFKRDDQFIVQVESSFHKRHMQHHAKLIRSILEPMLPASMDIFIATADELATAKVSA